MLDQIGVLKRCNLFVRLSTEQLVRIESRSKSRSFSTLDPVYLPAEKANCVFLLAQGLVKVCHLTADGKELVLGFVEPGELFGEQAIFDSGERDEYVAAAAPSTVVMIPVEEVRHLMAERADIALDITRTICVRRHRIERRLKNLMFLSNHDRLVHLLLDLADQFGWRSDKDESVLLRIKLSHQALANMIGSTRETVTVILAQLKAAGSVDGGRCRIVLTSPRLLARSVDRQVPRAAQ